MQSEKRKISRSQRLFASRAPRFAICGPHFALSLLAPVLVVFFSVSRVSARLFPPSVFTDNARGTTAAAFLKTPASARLAALGSGAAALSAPDALFGNPAGAAYLPKDAYSVLLGYESLLEGAGRTEVAGLKGLGRGTVGLGMIYRYETGLRKYDIYGEQGAAFEAYDAAYIATYGQRFTNADAGVAVKYLRSKLADSSAGSLALDAGVIIKGGKDNGTDLAFFARNFGAPQKLGSEAAPLPFELGAGLGWRLIPRFGLFIDGRLPADHSPYLILAGEYAIPFAAAAEASAAKLGEGAAGVKLSSARSRDRAVRSGLFLRAGLNFKNNSDLGLLSAFSAGFGVKLGEIGLDYAFVPYGDLGSTHRFTLGWGFGGAAAAAPAVSVSSGTAAASEKLSLAVAAFEPGEGVPESVARQVSDLLEAELAKTEVFSVVARTDMNFILAEKKLAYSGLSQKDGAAGLARLVGARAAVFGGVAKAAKGYLITFSMVDAGTGKTLASDSLTVEEDYLLKQAAREAAGSLALAAR